MLTPFVLVFGLTVATAVIAYWSDNLGKKLGKKRVSLLGLRPRTTATLLTIASSWGIMLFTLAVLLIVWSPLRNALLRYDRERRANLELRQNTRALEARLAQQEQEADESEDRLRKAQARLVAVRQELQDIRQDLNQTRKSLNQARAGETRARQGQVAATRRARAAAQLARSAGEQARAARQRLFTTQNRLEFTRTQFNQAAEALKREKGQLAEVNLQLDKAQKSYLAAKADYEKASRDYNTALAAQKRAERLSKQAQLTANRAREEAVRIGKESLEIGRQLLVMENRLSEANLAVEQRKLEAERIRQAAGEIASENLQFAEGQIRVGKGRTIAERMVSSRQTVTQARATLEELVEEARRNLVGIAGPNSSLTILPLRIMEGSTERILNAEEVMNVAAQYTAGRPERLSVRVVAAWNFLAGENDISAKFSVVPAAVVYPRGVTIIEDTVDGRQGDADIFKALNKLIEDGRVVAEQNGISAPLSPAQPDFYAAGTIEKLFETLRQVSAIKRPVVVRLVAAADQTRAEPLQVEFEVE